MPGFTYRVIDTDGKERKGNMNASTQEQVEKRLVSEGLILVDVDKDDLLEDDSLFGRGKITYIDLANFCRQLSHFLKAGIGTINSLKMMAEQTDNRKLVNIINYLIDRVSEGDSLSIAMSGLDVFPDEMIAVAESGENSGKLIEYLELIAVHYDKTNEREDMLKKSVRYPVFMFVLTLLVIIGVLVFVVPGYMSMIDDIDIVLPMSTRIMMGLSALLSSKWWLLLIIVLVIVGGIYLFYNSPTGRIMRSRFRIHYHGVCNHRQLDDCASFTRLMSTLLAADIPLSKALELTANSFRSHIILRRYLLRVRDQIAIGGSLSKNLDNTDILPKLLVNMIGVGEESGSLKAMFENAAEYYENEFANSVRRMTAILESLVIIFLAVLLGITVMSLVKPLIILYEAVGSM